MRSQNTVVSMHYRFILVLTVTVSVEFSYIVRRKMITLNPERKLISSAAIPIFVCTAYQGDEEYSWILCA